MEGLHAIFCAAVRARRKELGLTQSDVAQALEITTTRYCEIERGRFVPRIDTIERIAYALDIAPSALLETPATNRSAAGRVKAR